MEPQLGSFSMESKNKYLPTNDLHQPSGYDEFLSARRSLFANGLKDLRNVKEQLYSAAEHFQDSYHRNDQKQMLLESLKDYISKSLLKTVDHLGCVTNKVNKLLDEHVNEVSETRLRVSGVEQRLRTCQICANYGELSQQSLMMQTPKYNKQYPVQEGCISGANKDKKELVMSSGLRKGYSGRTSTELPSDLITFSLTKAASHKKQEKRPRSRSMPPLRFSIKCTGSSAIQPTCPSFSVKLSASSSCVITATTRGYEISNLVPTKTKHKRYGNLLEENKKPFQSIASYIQVKEQYYIVQITRKKPYLYVLEG